MTGVVVLTPNPAVDVTYTVEHQRVGETVRVRDVRRAPGGKGVNVVRVLGTLGLDPLALLPLGGAAGAWLADELGRHGVRTTVLPVAADTRSTVTVVDGVHEPTVLTEPGGPLGAPAWARLHELVHESCSAGGFLVVSGSFPPGTTDDDVAGVVVAAHDRGTLVVVDTSGPALLAAAAAGADVLKPNAAEAVEATSTDDAVQAVAALQRLGARTVVVSAGGDGLLGHPCDGPVWHQPAVPAVHGNPTGAGDAATAGLVAALARGADLAGALARAAVLGAAAVLRPGAGDVDPSDLPGLTDRLPAGSPARQRRSPTPDPDHQELS